MVSPGSDRLLRDLPDVATGILEARGPDASGPIHRTVQERDASPREIGAQSVDVVNPDRELEARSGLGRGNRRRPDKRGGLLDLQQVDDRVPEVEDGRRLVL